MAYYWESASLRFVGKDGLIRKKYTRVPFTGSGEVFLEYGTWQVNCKDGKIEGLIEEFDENGELVE